MRHPEQDIALLLIFALIVFVLYTLFRYFCNVEYADRQGKRLQIFVLIGSMDLIIACSLLANDLIAWYKDYFFMYVWPIEHRSSLQIVAGNFILALLTYGIALLIVNRRLNERWLPGLVSVLCITCLAMAASVFSVYISSRGFCCESPVEVFAGFPFSFLRGGLPYHLNYENLLHLSMIDIIQQYGSQLYWYLDIERLLFNCLFWVNAAIILLIGWNRLFRRNQTTS